VETLPFTFSEDGGVTWVLSAITPVQRMTCDITHAMPTGENHPRGDLHAGTLACASFITLDESESNDVSASAVMNVQSRAPNVDQPFVRALGISNTDHIYIGLNDFNQPNGTRQLWTSPWMAVRLTSLYRSKRERLRTRWPLRSAAVAAATTPFTQRFWGGENSTAPLRLVT